jgi:hypothetical protein
MTPIDVRVCIAVYRGLGGFSEAIDNRPSPGALFIQPVVLGVALGSLLRPFALQTSGRSIQHTPCQPGDSPHHSTSEDSYFSGSVWLVRPLNEAYLLQSEKTRDKDLKKHDDLDHHAH